MTGKTNNPFLNRAYQLKNHDDTQSMYSDWADSYDQTMRDHDYQSPRRIVEALIRHRPDRNISIFDVGCGTGLSGLALSTAGYQNIDGSDVSPEMVDKARQLDGVYRQLDVVSLDNPFPFENGTYDVITAMGVIADQHAPPETITNLLGKISKDGLLIFSLNNHTLENPAYLNTCLDAQDKGIATILEDHEGPHMVKLGMTSKIMVMQKN